MSTSRRVRFFVLIFAATLLVSRSASAQCSRSNLVEQRFPTSGVEQTRWRICWLEQAKNGLVITAAFFRTSPSSPWIRVLWDARVSEIFVPYHDGSPRYYDVTNFTFNLVQVSAADCPPTIGGTPLGSPAHVCKEVRDRGLAWKDYGLVRRGQELALWGALGAGNYNYVMEWAFRDDGTITGRVGATAVNLPSKPMMPHMHNPLWRLDVDLNGFPGDSVALGTHTEVGLNGNDVEQAIPSEASRDWDPHAFNTLDVSDATLKNGHGHSTSYRLVPLPLGMSRHQESFTQHDFWVTRYNPSEMFAKDLPTYVGTSQPVANADVVIWYKGSIHHHPRDEDGEFIDRAWRGEALIMWTGFMLMPHDLFDRTPLHP